MKVYAPISTPRATSTRCTAPDCPSGATNELKPTSTAAIPTNEWNAAISSGIWVISTLRAIGVPITAPIASTTMISSRVMSTERRFWWSLFDRYSECVMVAPRASTMPTMPTTVPIRAVVGLDRPANDRMNSTPATMYVPWMSWSSMLTPPS